MDKEIIVYGATWCRDCRRVKKVLAEHQIPYAWVDTENDAEAKAHVMDPNGGSYRLPTLVFPDGKAISEPGNAKLLVRLGVTSRASKPCYDVIIVEEAGLGGQVGLTQIVDNFPGFDEGIGGADFARRLASQAQRFGGEALQGEQITDIVRDGQYLVLL